jgi:Zn-dependent peptidase ImmA (M78 family)
MNRREMLLEAIGEAGRLHKQLDSEPLVTSVGGGIDVFGIINQLSVPLIFRPLKGLLGAFLPKPSPGIMVTTERGLSVQRFTGAHELGHYVLHHPLSLDDDSILVRYPFGTKTYDSVEAAADAFAASFLMPRWLIESHADRQGWSAESFDNPHTVYQLSLRTGVSYEAACRSLEQHRVINKSTRKSHGVIQPKKLKQELMGNRPMADWYPDVWVLTDRDRGTLIQGGPNDVFLIHLKEKSGAGYLWNVTELEKSGFVIVADERRIPLESQVVGGAVDRLLVARSQSQVAGELDLEQARPWDPTSVADHFTVQYELFGKESGKPRFERKRMVATA